MRDRVLTKEEFISSVIEAKCFNDEEDRCKSCPMALINSEDEYENCISILIRVEYGINTIERLTPFLEGIKNFSFRNNKKILNRVIKKSNN